jgi:hypothetical protein
MGHRRFEIRVKGKLGEDWREWFDGLAIHVEADDVTVLHGPLVDQSALHGVLSRIRDLNLELISVNAVPGERRRNMHPSQTMVLAAAGDRAAGADARWKWLWRIGGLAALLAAFLFRRNLGVEFMLLRSSGILRFGPAAAPETIVEWFSLLQSSRLLGLVLLNVVDIVNYGLVGLLFLALYSVLRRGNESVMAIALALGFVGIAVYFASNQAFTMLALSSQYAAATTEAHRAQLLSAGQAVLAVSYNDAYEGQGPYMSFLFVSVSGLMISAVMLRTRRFGRSTAVMGILANAFGLGYYVALAFAPSLVALPLSIAAVFLLAWYIPVGLKLCKGVF